MVELKLRSGIFQCVRSGRRHSRGVVYVEFLIAFIPLFLLFLGVCQLVLLTAARLIVSHAAATAVRAAIVVLEDPADDYGGAPRGNLSQGKSGSFDSSELLKRLSLAGAKSSFTDSSKVAPQHGARMAAIRLAATTPLLTLAPKSAVTSGENLERSLVSNSVVQLASAYAYTEATTAVAIKPDEQTDSLAVEPIDPKGAVTVEVTYLYTCGVPVVRSLLCSTLSSLLDSHGDSAGAKEAERLSQFANPLALRVLTLMAGRYTILKGQATLTNQGAAYLTVESNP
jgi:hypothetical protein